MAKNNNNNSSRHIENLFYVLLSTILAIFITTIAVLFAKVDALREQISDINEKSVERHIHITEAIANIPKIKWDDVKKTPDNPINKQ
ncbi:MAG: hypothetical protein HQL05_15880 [Nitrospirae bacterium]|uniref:hypothetical protein n=1 Tax=Candidatus Magnetobacterium casense TaxID=1455061 RepID=UPI00058B35B1|nr:hypothetical protein [Candidatus Magnetobacterium casensis]MBF0339299.1 hypothetical protein [Nitrospirota bacterium]